jgi:hypothetical protein
MQECPGCGGAKKVDKLTYGRGRESKKVIKKEKVNCSDCGGKGQVPMDWENTLMRGTGRRNCCNTPSGGAHLPNCGG